jgi:3-oxoacyl-ACP reductase-like protein
MVPAELTIGIVAQIGAVAAAVYMFTSIAQVMMADVVTLPLDKLEALARKKTGVKDGELYPLRGKVAIVTGSTNGLGEQIAIHMYRLGATVVIASRTYDKCVSTGKNMSKLYPESCGKICTHALDTSDLQSVKDFANWFLKEKNRLDFLINNAGKHLSCI